MDLAAIQADQVTLNSLVQNLVYLSGTVGAITAAVGVPLFIALMRRRSVGNA